MFRVLRRLGVGGFGEIYEGVNVATNEHVAIKLEPVSTQHPQLQIEAKLYDKLQNHMRVPKKYFFGREGAFNILVLQKLGESVYDEMQLYGRMYAPHFKNVAQHMISLVQKLHEFGYIHRDLKPENFLYDTTSNSYRHLYLIDFGMAKRIIVDGQHIPQIKKQVMVGTLRYASYANHVAEEQGRKDDLESLGYVLLYCYYGYLPWQQESDVSMITAKKHKNQRRHLLQFAPTYMQQYFNHIDNLKFDDTPNYIYLFQLFN
jgi:serine/threonine protein kinase